MREFITALYEGLDGEASIWHRPESGPTAVNGSKWFTLPGQLEELITYAETLRDKDAYIPIGTFTTQNRSASNAHQSQVVYQDTDAMDPAKYRIPPSMIVNTSRGRTQCWWMLDKIHPSQDVAEVSRLITVAHREDGADPSSWPSNKLMRLPGSVNTGHGGFPEDVTVESSIGNVYSLDEIRAAYSDVKIAEPTREVVDLDIPTPDDLPEYGPILDTLSHELLELALNEPGPNVDRSRMRYKLLIELYSSGYDDNEVASVAWHAPASNKWSREDPRGIHGLYAEMAKAKAEADIPQEIQAPSTLATGPPEDTATFVPLLTEAERVLTVSTNSFIRTYTALAKTRVPKQNLPYDRGNAWSLAALSFGDFAFIPRTNGGESCNFYMGVLGDTTTGKSAAKKFLMQSSNEYFVGDAGYNIGGNASANALGKKLLERDNKTSFFNKDEAHGTIKQWSGSAKDNWTAGLMEDLAELYDGIVSPQLRTGSWDTSGKVAKAYFNMHLMGTPDAMVAALNRDMFLSGFLARFQWVVGEPRVLSKKSMEEKDSDGQDGILGFDPMARQMGVSLRLIRKQFNMARLPVPIAPDAAKRLTDAKWTLVTSYSKDRNHDIIEPSLLRMGVTIRKAATLLAVTEGRSRIEMIDVLRALEAAEEWVQNLLLIASKVSASDFERSCDAVENYINGRMDATARESEVKHRFRNIEDHIMDRYINALIAQGRIARVRDKEKRIDFLQIVR